MLNDKELELLNKIQKKAVYEDNFFEKRSEVKWFDELIKRGYFNPNPDTCPQESKEEGLFRIPQWNVLPYLERVSQQVDISGNEKYIDELLVIIKKVSSYKDSDGKHIDNYRTWYYFVKILLNLPNEKIGQEIISLISIWLDSNFSTSLPGADIARKLLPKFLDSDHPEDWKKAEKIVEIITNIKWFQLPEKETDLFRRKEEPKTIVDSYWLSKSFKVTAPKVGEKCSANIIYILADRLKEIIRRMRRNIVLDTIESKDDKYNLVLSMLDENKFQIQIALIKGQHTQKEHFQYPSKAPQSETIVEFELEECKTEKDVIEGIKNNISEHSILKKFSDIIPKFRQLYDALYVDYSYISFPSLYKNPDVGERDADITLISILRDILLSKAKHDVAQTKEIMTRFLGTDYKYPIFRRICMFVCGTKWESYKDIFIHMIMEEGLRYFDEPHYKPEIYELLKNNHDKFNNEEKDLIKNIIETGPQDLPVEDEKKEDYIAYWKQKWYLPMKSDPEFKSLYEEQRKIVAVPEEEPKFETVTVDWIGPGTSPKTKEEILNLSNEELVNNLKEFKTKDSWKGPTVRGFAEVLKEVTKENPEKFIDNLNSFENVGFVYIYKILDGIKDAWKEKVTINWGKVFEFIFLYIKKDQFWNDEYIVDKDEWLGGANHEWVVGIIAELIQDGTRDDKWAFSEEHFERAEKIISLILDKLKAEEEKEITDYVTYTLNTPFGKSITALILFSLRIARVNDKKGISSDIKWKSKYKEKYDEILRSKIIEGFTCLGRYLPNLYYLDKGWVEKKIKSLENEKGNKYWEAFMGGYLSIGRVYDDLYDLMKLHYQYGMEHNFKDNHDNELIVQHISLGYLRGHEDIDKTGSLFKLILDCWRKEQIQEIISFFWMQRSILKVSSEENEKMKGRIIEFWRYLYEKYKDKDEASLSKKDKQILSSASKLGIILPLIDAESYEWLMVSAPYVHENYNSSFFIEYLDELKNRGERSETAKYVGDIYLKMLEKITPDFDQKHIQSIVDFLYGAGATEGANRICNIYGSRGYEFLRDIYERYSKRT